MKKLILISVLFLGTSWSFAQERNLLEGKRLYEKTDSGREYFNFKSGDFFHMRLQRSWSVSIKGGLNTHLREK